MINILEYDIVDKAINRVYVTSSHCVIYTVHREAD